jgi:hypothetical protein
VSSPTSSQCRHAVRCRDESSDGSRARARRHAVWDGGARGHAHRERDT